jgi:hypothetical protein
VEAVAPGDQVGFQHVLLAPVRVPDRSRGVDGHVAHLEVQRQPGRQARLDQVLDDLLLAVDRDRPAGQLLERDPVPLPVEAQLDALVDQPLGVHPRAEPDLVHQVHRRLLEHPGAHALLHVLPVAHLEDHRLDPA